MKRLGLVFAVVLGLGVAWTVMVVLTRLANLVALRRPSFRRQGHAGRGGPHGAPTNCSSCLGTRARIRAAGRYRG